MKIKLITHKTIVYNMAFSSRGKNKIQKPLGLNLAYNYYLKDIQLDSKYNIEWKEYKSILSEFNKMMMEEIVENGYMFKLPYRLGVLRIKKRKNNLDRLKPDWSMYNTSDKSIKNKYLNEHTDNYYVRFYWSKAKDTIVKNKTLYSFIPTRDNKRYLSSLLKTEGLNQINKYFE